LLNQGVLWSDSTKKTKFIGLNSRRCKKQEVFYTSYSRDLKASINLFFPWILSAESHFLLKILLFFSFIFICFLALVSEPSLWIPTSLFKYYRSQHYTIDFGS
jgi:hypothetical protein